MLIHGGRVVALDPSPLHPGEEGNAEIEPFLPEAWIDLMPGDVITCYEGLRAVASATVIRSN